MEVYEVDGGASPSKLINISTRGSVETSENVMIAGLIIVGNAPKTVLIGAVGRRWEMRRSLCQEAWQILFYDYFPARCYCSER